MFSLAITLSFWAIWAVEDGHADPFGMRFTTGKKSALIVGNSRAAQGLIPDLITQEILGADALDLYNYSFGIGYSAYGPVYLNSIMDKLEQDEKNGLFIVTTDPWALVEGGRHPNDPGFFPEQDSPLAALDNQSFKPHLAYMLHWFGPSYYEIIHRHFRPANERLHRESGWLELVLPMDTATVNYRIQEKLKDFRNGYKNLQLSQTRLDYLEKTIRVLKEHGKVVLVYMPAHPKIMKYDRLVLPEFPILMKEISEKYQIPYRDYSGQAEKFTYTDGIHLYQDSGRKISKDLGQWINSQL
ncbi:hypothetical protein KZP23_14485 [Echinicola marina]|uniref:hypothetical protein n=1 Tax=Echinicola marina TaxID=2859768 RepID=UPI001CF6638F|nr:hypothetical protein [Echinicola marina]UCS91930.1 hypothetical protein KZP23_14485 [Echinicola marina]